MTSGSPQSLYRVQNNCVRYQLHFTSIPILPTAGGPLNVSDSPDIVDREMLKASDHDNLDDMVAVLSERLADFSISDEMAQVASIILWITQRRH
jgi:hypothetical protein